MYKNTYSRISSLQFGTLSPEETRKNSVTEITKYQSFKADGKPIPQGLFDTKMSPTDKSERCETDLLPMDLTPGYFGRIELNVPIYNHFFIDTISEILSLICIECGNLLIPPFDSEKNPKSMSIEKIIHYSDKLIPSEKDLLSLPKKLRIARLKKIEQKKDEDKICPICSCIQPKKYVKNLRTIDSIDAVYKNKDIRSIYPEYVYRLFKKISSKSCSILGLDYYNSNPSSLVLHNIPVCPPLCRPFIKQGNGLLSQDHITLRYEEILKSNMTIKGYLNKGQHKQRERFREYLAHDIATLFDNDPNGIFPSLPRGASQPHQTFAQRLRGKEPKNGRIRGNLLSRRVEMSGRSVITPDPMIDLNEIGIPKKIAKTISYPEKVNLSNRSFLEKCIENGKDVYPGALGLIRNNTNFTIKPKPKTLLEVGDIVLRHLIDGDYVLMNRQPTLHKKSFMGHKVKIMDGYSFKLNVNVTEPYNADFDGDEMNLHCPQTISTLTEVIELAGLKNQNMSGASNSPAIAFVQDNVLAAYMMTTNQNAFSQREFMNVIARGAPYYYGISSKNSFSGKEILSFFTPNYTDTITKTVNKKDLIKIISKCYHEFGEHKCFEMTGSMQKLLNEYLIHHTYSIGPKDLQRSKEIHNKVDDAASQMIKNISKRIEKIHNSQVNCDKDLFEQFVNEEIAKATSISENLLYKDEKSRFEPMIKSGSKGKKKNITQMKGFLGQQIVNGKRTNTGYTNRTLPHFHKYSEDISTRGFVRSSLSKGLHPFEFFFHAGGGREGLIEQALQTGQTGYIQRQMVKTLEDMTIKWSHTVNDAQNNIVQFSYGDDNATGESIQEINIRNIFCSYDQLDLKYNLLSNASKEHLKISIEPQIIKQIPQDTKLFEKYFEQFIEMRNELIDDIINTEKESNQSNMFKVYHSINIDEKLQIIINKYKLSKTNKTDLDPTTILISYKELFERCSISQFFECDYLFKFLVYAKAGPKQLICEHRLTREAFKEFLLNLEKSYKFSRIEPGEPVGIIAAQSIGEPCTQLTLNSFHFAGAGRSQGVPRLKELMYLEPSGRNNSSSHIYLREPHCFIEKDAQIILSEIESITIKDILKSYEFFFDSKNVSNEKVLHYKKLEIETGVHETITSPWILRFELLKTKTSSLYDTWAILNDQDYINNPILDIENYAIFFRIDVEDATNANGKNRIIPLPKKGEIPMDFQISKINDIVDIGILPLQINGIQNISNAKVEQFISYYRDPIVGSVIEKKKYFITANGSQLIDLFNNPAIDTQKTVSNNVLDIYETFGIEAARHILIEELSAVLKDVGDLDIRHISLLVDRMVGTGTLLSVNMRGMDGYENGPLTKASFERITNEFINAGLRGEVENVNGMASNIITGQAPPTGTGTVSVSIDEEMFNQFYIFKNTTKSKKGKKSTTKQNYKKKNIVHFSID
tara:strand:- start:2188 stop:6489 length:4302 start_codon:yes stop_codon:yes gene_type:complete